MTGTDRRAERAAARRAKDAPRPGDRDRLDGRRPRRPRHADPDQPRLARGPRHVLRRRGVPRLVPGHREGVLARHPGVLHRRGGGAGPRPGGRADADDRGPGAVPAAAARRRLHRRLPRHPDGPARLPDRLRRPGAGQHRRAPTSAGCRPSRWSSAGSRSTLSYGAYVSEVYRAGLQLGPPRPARRRARDRAHRAARRCAT